jgi:hypothetical protein
MCLHLLSSFVLLESLPLAFILFLQLRISSGPFCFSIGRDRGGLEGMIKGW